MTDTTQLGRIIPARAGFTRILTLRPLPRRDHPRSRGVYAYGDRHTSNGQGSSPLARGLLIVHRASGVIRRIIPARAGFTGGGFTSSANSSDHPRSRGVYAAMRSEKSATVGSSPLARGLHPNNSGLSTIGGIIPARAGFTPGGVPRYDLR